MKEKNLTGTEIIERCKEYGVEISESYFSRIKNNKKNPPSEDVSRAIAKACGVDERLLVIEGYIDKSPREIQKAFTYIDFMSKAATSKMLKLIKKGDIKKLEEYLENLPVSDTIIDILDGKEKYIDFLENNYTFERIGNGFGLSMLLKEPFGFDVEDNSMFPIIQKGDKVGIELINHYISTDILLVQYKKHKYIRYIQKINNTIKLVPICKTYKEIICNKEDVLILGRINNIIRKI